MRKIFLVSLAAIVVSTAFVAIAEPPEHITIDACASKKAPVEFPHQAHFEVTDCVTCHHTAEGLTLETAADMEVAACASCHAEPEKADTPLCSEKSLKKNPFHIACVGCHKTEKKAAKAEGKDFKGPTSCKGCHPKAAK